MRAQPRLAWISAPAYVRTLDAPRLLFFTIVLYGGAMIWLAPHPPMIDLPQHAAQVAALHGLLTAESPWSQVLRINLFTPYLIGYGLALLLSFLMPIAAAFKLLLTLGYYSFVGACLLLRRRFDADQRLDWLFVPAYFGFAYEWGFLTFLVAAPLGLLFLLLADRYAERPTGTSGARLLLAGTALFFSHGLVFLFASLIGVACTTLKNRGLKRCALAMSPYGLLAILCVVYAWNTRELESAFVYAAPEIVWAIDWTRLPLLLLTPWGSWEQQTPLAIYSLLFLAAPWLLGLRPNWRNPSSCVPAFAVLAVWTLAPHYAMRTAFLYQRFGLFIFPCYALMFHRPASSTAPAGMQRYRALLCQTLLALICVSFFGYQTKRLIGFAAESSEFDAVASMAEPAQRALMLIFDANSAMASHPGAYLHYAAWYQAENEGLVDFNFAWFLPQIIRYRPDQLPALRPAYYPPGTPSSAKFPRTFNWEKVRAQDYRYYFVRTAAIPNQGLFKNEHCDVVLLKHSGSWSLYENRGCR